MSRRASAGGTQPRGGLPHNGPARRHGRSPAV